MGQETSHEQVDDGVPPRTLQSRTIASVAKLIKDGDAKRIVVLTGAGISTSAGIPDFRSPETGLYANLAKLNLPFAEAVFDISYFRVNPDPFYALAGELYPGKFKPTVSHAFIALLAKKGLLRMLFTQNIDCLERAAGVPSEKIVEAHGSFATQRCIECRTEFPDDLMRSAIESGEVPHCQVPQCNGLVKPDIVFFGEQLPEKFFANRHVPAQADLMLVIGTSLSVHPFASLPEFASQGVPRVLFNKEKVGSFGSRLDDVCVLGDCDTGTRSLADALGWRDELEELWTEVSGGKKDDTEPVPQKESKTKDELLEEEIEKLAGEVDRALKVADGHKKALEEHLESKISKGPPPQAAEVPEKDSLKADIEEAKSMSETPISTPGIKSDKVASSTVVPAVKTSDDEKNALASAEAVTTRSEGDDGNNQNQHKTPNSHI